MSGWLLTAGAFGTLTLTLMSLFRYPAHGFAPLRYGIGYSLLLGAFGMLYFLITWQEAWLGILGFLCGLDGLLGGSLLLTRMEKYEKKSKKKKKRQLKKVGPISDLLLLVFVSVLQVAGALTLLLT